MATNLQAALALAGLTSAAALVAQVPRDHQSDNVGNTLALSSRFAMDDEVWRGCISGVARTYARLTNEGLDAIATAALVHCSWQQESLRAGVIDLIGPVETDALIERKRRQMLEIAGAAAASERQGRLTGVR